MHIKLSFSWRILDRSLESSIWDPHLSPDSISITTSISAFRHLNLLGVLTWPISIILKLDFICIFTCKSDQFYPILYYLSKTLLNQILSCAMLCNIMQCNSISFNPIESYPIQSWPTVWSDPIRSDSKFDGERMWCDLMWCDIMLLDAISFNMMFG